MKMLLDVPKMKCGGCAETIQETLGALAGVSNLQVDVDQKRVSLELDPAQTPEEVVRQRLADAGFPAA